MPTVHQINIKPATQGEGGIPKTPTAEAAVTAHGLAGDFNRYRHEKKNDTPDRALLLLPLETVLDLQAAGWPVEPGHVGEGVTTSGIPYAELALGSRYRRGWYARVVTEGTLRQGDTVEALG